MQRGAGNVRAGTMAWAAPERLRGGAATCAGDVYSLGVTLYEVRSLSARSLAPPLATVHLRGSDLQLIGHLVALRQTFPQASEDFISFVVRTAVRADNNGLPENMVTSY